MQLVSPAPALAAAGVIQALGMLNAQLCAENRLPPARRRAQKPEAPGAARAEPITPLLARAAALIAVLTLRGATAPLPALRVAPVLKEELAGRSLAMSGAGCEFGCVSGGARGCAWVRQVYSEVGPRAPR